MQIELLAIERANEYRHGSFTYDGTTTRYVMTYAISFCGAKTADIIDAIENLPDIELHECIVREGVYHIGLIVPKDDWRQVEKILTKAIKDLPGSETPAKHTPDVKADKLLVVEALQIQLGYKLIPLIKMGLLEQISNIRNELILTLGVILPPVTIRDNLALGADEYMVIIREEAAITGSLEIERLMAIDNGLATAPVIDGIETIEPAFQTTAYWVKSEHRAAAELANWTVVGPEAVLAIHFSQIVQSNADELITRQTTSDLLDELKKRSPALVAEVIAQVRIGIIQSILRRLLRLGSSIRDLESILEVIGNHYPETDPEILTAHIMETLDGTNSNNRGILRNGPTDTDGGPASTADPKPLSADIRDQAKPPR